MKKTIFILLILSAITLLSVGVAQASIGDSCTSDSDCNSYGHCGESGTCECLDIDDSGNDPLGPGNASGVNLSDGIEVSNAYDYCISGNLLKEFYCEDETTFTEVEVDCAAEYAGTCQTDPYRRGYCAPSVVGDSCTDDSECVSGSCGYDSTCVECDEDSDCPDGNCVSNVCDVAQECDSSSDCEDIYGSGALYTCIDHICVENSATVFDGTTEGGGEADLGDLEADETSACALHLDCSDGFRCIKSDGECRTECTKNRHCQIMQGYRCDKASAACTIDGSAGSVGRSAPGEVPGWLSNTLAAIMFWK